MHDRPATWKKVSAVSQATPCPGQLGVQQQRRYCLNDEKETDVEPDSIVKGKVTGGSGCRENTTESSALGQAEGFSSSPQAIGMARVWCPSQMRMRVR